MGVGQGAGIVLSRFHEIESSLGQEFELFREFSLFWEFYEIHENCDFPGSASAPQGLAVNQSSGGEKNCVVYSLFYIFMIIIIIVSSSSIFFVVLLNCLYLKLRVLLFVHFSSPSHCGGRGRVSEELCSAELLTAELNHSR